MKKKNKFLVGLASLTLVAALAGCGSKEDSKGQAEAIDENKIVVGVTSGPHEQIAEVAAKVAKEKGLEVELKSFSDYVLPNTSLAEGDLDANSYQHEPFLDTFNKDHDTDLVPVGKTILNPMGIYSEKYKSFDDIPDGATFGLPNDPTNGARALFVLQEAGYIKLKDGADLTASIRDVEENKKNLQFIELEAAQIPKQLSEVDVAAINTNFALEAGINPKEDSILLESTDSPYVNYIVVRAENENDPTIKKFVEAYQSEEVRQFIEEEFKGSVIPSW
ncbi:MetQ/NlpA family ABC transporter substrate-binding protein [Lysinibacillus irui]|uniref:Lipoprotein n=1 Tax=Lysinibacillus irui TaxID=2998077 RepID=A0AAJ5URT6_9BACI|nr:MULTISPECIES: MetQ/NlpA family ABC transporter substrate-binding protein [Lysinibacillus]MEA0553893.1 MetQ/NlpA family ABC transporter substrate-binding protein [Lysinibacillus irui]MEA0562035.1 MetQ/NlpA family ABC transporter substrate-binding protein [Lysinibacillus irui]MEA0975165.1 MetQ/NlpA family ABC transporter substrate-binding protein [Lysinibacillus irui]MEA1041319.1 MetQ/NlpA family ABC transporter substrate-binding protein [Lysinibacillus irui]WDV07301.1 MetQ/NlpA family ABC tr